MTEIADDEKSQDPYKSTDSRSEVKHDSYNSQIEPQKQDQNMTLASADFANVSIWTKLLFKKVSSLF